MVYDPFTLCCSTAAGYSSVPGDHEDITSLSARPLLCFTCANYTSSSSSLIEEHEIKLKQLFPKCSSAEICWFCFRPHPFFPAISEAVIKDISYKPCYTKLAHTFSRTVWVRVQFHLNFQVDWYNILLTFFLKPKNGFSLKKYIYPESIK